MQRQRATEHWPVTNHRKMPLAAKQRDTDGSLKRARNVEEQLLDHNFDPHLVLYISEILTSMAGAVR